MRSHTLIPAAAPLRLLAVLLVLGVAIGAAALVAGPQDRAEAALSCVNDDRGANDVPGQKDLTQMCFEAPTSGTQHITWNWDELGTSGNNTLDACALFDTDADGKANFAVCAVTTGNPAVAQDTITYTCNDARSDRCSGKQLASGQQSSCSVTQTNTDPFPAGAASPRDTTSDCNVVLADVGAAGSVLLNVCSYPSGEPNSDPSDCVVVPDLPHLTLAKVVVSDNGGTLTTANFTLTATGPTTISGVSGSAAVTGAAVPAGTYTLSESAQAGYAASAWVCSGGTQNGSSITLSFGQSATCTITNNDQAPSLTLVKSVVNDSGGSAVAADWTLTATGYDPASPDAGTYALSESGPAGYTLTSLTCSNASGQVTSVTLALGEQVTCTFVNDDQQSTPSFSTLIVPNDQATLTSFVTGAPTPGSITFELYGPDDAGCVGTPKYTETVSDIAAGGTYMTTNTTFAIAETETGVWRWKVSYSGDEFNSPAESACGTERFTVAYGAE
jgi:hypothetical protein